MYLVQNLLEVIPYLILVIRCLPPSRTDTVPPPAPHIKGKVGRDIWALALFLMDLLYIGPRSSIFVSHSRSFSNFSVIPAVGIIEPSIPSHTSARL